MEPSAGTGARQQLYRAVLVLASEIGPVEDRLALVFWKHLRSIEVTELPAEAQRRLELILAELQQLYPAPGVINLLDRNIPGKVAAEIILLYDDLLS